MIARWSSNKVSLKNLTCLTLPILLTQKNKKGTNYTKNQVLDHLTTINSMLKKFALNVHQYMIYSVD